MLDFICLLSGITIGTLIYKKISVPFAFVVFLLIIIFIFECAAWCASEIWQNNLLVYSVGSIIIPVFFFLIYIKKLNTRKTLYHHLSFAILYLFILINTIYIQSEEPLPTNNQQATCLYFILLSVFQYNQLLKGPAEMPLSRNSEFWLNTTLFIYFSGTFVPWVVFNMFLKSAADFDSILEWNYYLTILLYVGLMVSMLIDAYGRTRPSE